MLKFIELVRNNGNYTDYFQEKIDNKEPLYLDILYFSDNLSDEFFYKFKDYIKDWKSVSIFKKLSEKFMIDFSDKLDFEKISFHQNLSESFIEKFSDRLNWLSLSVTQKLSESFIVKYQDLIDWESISYKQKLSEDFIRNFKDKVSWKVISFKQDLSEKFLEEFYEYISWEEVPCNNLSEKFIKKYISIRIYQNLLYKKFQID